MSRWLQALKILLSTTLLIAGAGCASFHYTPGHDQVYGLDLKREGLAIRTGEDLRPAAEKQPGWAENAEAIVAHALADEVRYAQLFKRVKIHADNVKPGKYSEIIQFRIQKFECASHPSFMESTGRTILRFQGIRGALIADSIPAKYTAEVEIEFGIQEAPGAPPVFVKSYSASRTVVLNGYQSKKPLIEQTSAALEAVLSQFLTDLARVK